MTTKDYENYSEPQLSTTLEDDLNTGQRRPRGTRIISCFVPIPLSDLQSRFVQLRWDLIFFSSPENSDESFSISLLIRG